MTITFEQIRSSASRFEGDSIDFLRRLIRTPSLSGREEKVVGLIRDEMRSVGFDEVRVDPFGNVAGRLGDGDHVIAFDAHVDTVDVGDPKQWKVDPFGGEIIDGVIYGRGASDQKAGMAALVYAGAALKELAFETNLTIWVVGSVLEEDCDGLCWHYILSEGLLSPELIVLTEPTNLHVYRGHRGRMELEVTLRGVSCHGSAPERGVNAIYRMAPVISAIERLQGNLASDEFLGPGSITTSQIRSVAPSLCAVADQCTIHLDRRLTAGETDRSAIAEIEMVLKTQSAGAGAPPHLGPDEIDVPIFREPSHTGLVYPMRQYFPAWALPADDPFVTLAVEARGRALGAVGSGEAGAAGKWVFSTNGVATRGLHGVPTIGFGPAHEIHAHAPTDQCPCDHLGQAMTFYLTLVGALAGAPEKLWRKPSL